MTVPGPETLRVTLPSDTRFLHLLSNLARNAAQAAGLDDGEAEKVALATDEAVTNVIRHAYRGNNERLLELRLELHEDRLEIHVIHDGEPLDESALPSSFDPVGLIRARRKGGIGVVLMSRLMDSVTYSATSDHRNECCLSKFTHPARSEG